MSTQLFIRIFREKFPPALMKVLALEILKKNFNNIRTPLFVVKKPLEVSELSGKAYKKI